MPITRDEKRDNTRRNPDGSIEVSVPALPVFECELGGLKQKAEKIRANLGELKRKVFCEEERFMGEQKIPQEGVIVTPDAFERDMLKFKEYLSNVLENLLYLMENSLWLSHERRMAIYRLYRKVMDEMMNNNLSYFEVCTRKQLLYEDDSMYQFPRLSDGINKEVAVVPHWRTLERGTILLPPPIFRKKVDKDELPTRPPSPVPPPPPPPPVSSSSSSSSSCKIPGAPKKPAPMPMPFRHSSSTMEINLQKEMEEFEELVKSVEEEVARKHRGSEEAPEEISDDDDKEDVIVYPCAKRPRN